jgi:hypothetical protein
MDFFRLGCIESSSKLRSVCENVQRSFGDVRKRAVPQIVNKCRKSNESGVLIVKLANFCHETGHVENTQSVLKPGVKCTWVDQIRERKLTNSSKALKDWCGNDVGFLAG